MLKGFVFLIFFILGFCRGNDEPLGILSIKSHDTSTYYYVQPATTGFERLWEKENSPELFVKYFNGYNGCEAKPITLGKDTALIVDRGNCSFKKKAENAQNMGASALVVVDTLKGMYNTTDIKLGVSGPCSVDCKQSLGFISPNLVTEEKAFAGYDQCLSGNQQCASKTCALDGNVRKNGDYRVCCVIDDYLVMHADNKSPVSFPGVFMTIADGEEFLGSIKNDSKIQLHYRSTSLIDPSSLILLFLGFNVVVFGSWQAVEIVRDSSTGTLETKAPGLSEEEVVPIQSNNIIGMLIGATIVLIGLFVLIELGLTNIVMLFIMLCFCLAAMSSMVQLVLLPIFKKSAPQKWNEVRTFRIIGEGTISELVAIGMASSLTIVWFICRHDSWTWFLQDLFGCVVCCLLFRVLQLNSGRTGALLLFAFFCYDIFMVFISPLIFNKSVMVEVATAGMKTPIENHDCYCRLNPDDTKYCGESETMPMLFIMPKLGHSLNDGYSMLGFGDIIFPGLFIVYALKYEMKSRLIQPPTASTVEASALLPNGSNSSSSTSTEESTMPVIARTLPLKKTLMKCQLWTLGLIGYFCGLVLTNIALVIMRQGQPALLYIVPCVVLPILFVTHRKGHLKSFWTGEIQTRSLPIIQYEETLERGPGKQDNGLWDILNHVI
eukprot:TRINITY_DN11262_c0_g1_i1.p1 TRINITY_DN11262_c0_g1~~TRINITY_DN11262_c0_g1_i1.p1  ORF type:complete len:663 (-),score=132.90 TRINITY_DN11262_c0_g1_i1:132-2120(-)